MQKLTKKALTKSLKELQKEDELLTDAMIEAVLASVKDVALAVTEEDYKDSRKVMTLIPGVAYSWKPQYESGADEYLDSLKPVLSDCSGGHRFIMWTRDGRTLKGRNGEAFTCPYHLTRQTKTRTGGRRSFLRPR